MKDKVANAKSEIDILGAGMIGKALKFFHKPAGWPGWLVWLLGLTLAGLAALSWRLIAGDSQAAIAAGVSQWLFTVGDLALLLALPKRGISFGPWKAQFFTLALPRTLATMLVSLAAVTIGLSWGIALLLLVQLLGTVLLIWGATVEPFQLQMTKLELVTDRLPSSAPPIRLLHISDMHVERLTRREESLLELVQEAEPDLIVITGDYVNLSYNRDPETHRQVRRVLAQLSAPYGVYATLGSPTVDLRETIVPIFDGLPIPLMREDWAQINLGDGRALVLLGMDCTHHLPTDAARLDRLMAAAPNSVPQVLLYHSPELMPQASQHDIDLYLCGHTHGGQVRLPLIGPLLTSSQLGRKYVMGLYRHGRTHLYVSRGVGLEGLSAPRVRFLAPPEMTLITLRGV